MFSLNHHCTLFCLNNVDINLNFQNIIQEIDWKAENWETIFLSFYNLGQLEYAGRDVSAVPAAGVAQTHKAEAQELLNKTFAL